MKSIWFLSLLVMLGGLGFGSLGAFPAWSNLDLVDVGRETQISEVVSFTRSREAYIEVDGHRYACWGGTRVGDAVVYDPAIPGVPYRCRAKWAVGGVNSYELFFLTVGGVVVLLGALGFAFEATLGRRDDDLVDLVKQGRLPAPPLDVGAAGGPRQRTSFEEDGKRR